jgi:predicted dinucleotide-binding enzyme
MANEKIAIVGAGNVGAALGERLGKSGFAVTFGLKAGTSAADAVVKAGSRAKAATVPEALRDADVVFVALPAPVAVSVLKETGDCANKIIVDCTNPVGWSKQPNGPTFDPPPEGSVAAALAKALPRARVVKAFNVFGAEFHRNPKLAHGEAADVPMASDDQAAKDTVAHIAKTAGFVPVDVGPLRNAALLESMALVWIHLALVGGKGRDFAFKMLGRG